MTNDMVPNPSTLYDRIGGEPSLRSAVAVFYERVPADRQPAPLFIGISIDRLRSHAFLSEACGGSRQYAGSSMAKAHARLNIEQKHVDAAAGHLVATPRLRDASWELIGDVAACVAPLSPETATTSPTTA